MPLPLSRLTPRFFAASALALALCSASPGLAQTRPPESPPQAFDHTRPVEPPPALPALPAAPAKNAPLSLSADELVAQPELLQRALDSSVVLNNLDAVKFLLPLYRRVSTRDLLLETYAQAVVDQAEGRYTAAIAGYRQMIAQHPELSPVRLRLALALAADRQTTAALDQFEKLKNEPALPDEVRHVADQALAALQKQDDWSFNASLQYLQDANVNNAPAEREIRFANGTLTLPPPQAAHGMRYFLAAEKRYSLDADLGLRLSAWADGKSYWDNATFNDWRARALAGPTWRDARSEVAVLPFYERRWFSGQPFSQTTGLRLEGSHWLTPHWQVLGAAEYGRKTHDQRRFLDGPTVLLSTTLLHAPRAQRYVFVGADAAHDGARDPSETYRRIGLRAGWGEEWAGGVSTLAVVGAARRSYEAPDFFNILRRDSERFATLSLWHRNLYFLGMTPRLVLSHNAVRSNHFAYPYAKNAAYLEVSRKF